MVYNDSVTSLNNTPDGQYWATTPPEEIGKYLDDRVQNYYNYLTISNYAILLRQVYYQYYCCVFDGGQTFKVGSNGQLTHVSYNLFKNLIDHQCTIINQQRQEMKCQPVNTDAESLAQVKIGDKLLDYTEDNKKLGDYIDRGVLHACLYGEGFITVEWDENDGDLYTYNLTAPGQPGDNRAVRSGDIVCRNFDPFNCIRDITKPSAEEVEWHIMRQFVNRHNLIAKYPQYKDEILALPAKYNDIHQSSLMNVMMFAPSDSDDVAFYTFFHKKTAACPEGRVVHFCNADLVLDSNPMPYKMYPVMRIAAGNLEGTSFGWTPSFDMLQLQELINGLVSGIQTNLEAGLVNNVWIPEQCNASEPEIIGDNSFVTYNKDGGEPKILDLAKTSPDAFTFLNILTQGLNTLSGISNVTQGQIPSANMSGAAMAYSNNMSLQFLNMLAKARVFAQEQQANMVISCYQDFANVPRVAAIAGKSNQGLMKEFTKHDLVYIQRVVAKTVNPLSKTPAGLEQILAAMLQAQLPITKQEIIQLYATGEIETTYEGQENELLLVKSENEDLMAGITPPVDVMDDHVLHISEHRFVTANPDVRKNPKLLAAAQQHIMDHITALGQLNPVLAQITGQPVINQSPQPAPGAAPTPQAAPPVAHPPGHRLHQPGNPVGHAGSPQSAIGPGNPIGAKASEVNLPNLPGPPKGTDAMTASAINTQRAANRPPTPTNPKAL